MILYKALFDYYSSDILDLHFKENDIIEFLSEKSESWYYGRNVMTGNTGLFPHNFVKCIDIPPTIEEEKIYIVIDDIGNQEKGDVVIECQLEDDYIMCHLLNDNTENIIAVPLTSLIKFKFSKDAPGYTKCIANCSHNAETSSNELSFLAGDIIWMERKINDIRGEGILRGKKGFFPLNKVLIEEIGCENPDRRNVWMTLFDYSGTDMNDLSIKKGEKLKFLDRIDNNWNLMQNTSGKVGMVPCSYVKNISINAPLAPSKLTMSEKEPSIIVPPQLELEINKLTIDSNYSFMNDITNHNENNQNEPDYANISMFESVNDDSQILFSFNFGNGENLYEDIIETETEIETVFESPKTADENEVPVLLIEQFKKREKRVENDIEVILDDMKSLQNQCSRETPNTEHVQKINCNLAFLKEEHKTKLKELEFIKEQRERLLSGDLQDIDESEYEYLQLSSLMMKQVTTRNKVIEEILETEKKFINDLKMTLEAYDRNHLKSKIPDQDYNLIFGDLESVVHVAEEFLSKLSLNLKDGLEKIAIGSIFLQFVSSFEEVYKEYCVNYDRKLDLINKKVKTQNFIEFINEGLQRLSNMGIISSALDMMLVKPLQRFLKYPLFLKTIIENSQPEHSDITDLQAALAAFEILAQKINEKKRFEELRAITFDRTEKWHMKTLHAIQKKPKRVIATISGVVQEEDNDYQTTVLKFKDLRKCISIFIETVFILRDNLKEILNLYSAISEDLTSILRSEFGSQLNFYLVICKRGESDYFKNYYTVANKICVLDSLVVNPLNKLLELFSGPRLLIKKRQSKYIDYLGMKQRCDDKDLSRMQIEKMDKLKNQYSAINNTLKDELPILISKATSVLNECLGNYLQLTTSSLQNSILSLRNLIEDDQLSTEEELRNCKNQQNEILNTLQKDLSSYNPTYRNSIFKGDFPSCLYSGSASTSVLRNCVYHQTEDDVLKLKAKYDPDNLALVKKDFIPNKPHQIHILAGSLVGIIKRCNPQGHSSSWLVELCPKRTGFVPRSYLTLFPLNNVTDGSIRSSKRNTSNRHSMAAESTFDLMQFSPNIYSDKRTSLTDANPGLNRTNRSSVSSSNIRVALFQHQSRGESEISMLKNDNLEVLENHDKSGSRDWCLVKNLRTGSQGYVPTNYLSK